MEVERDYQTKSESLDEVTEAPGTFGRQGDAKDDSQMPIPEVIELRDMIKTVLPDEKAHLAP